MVWKENPRYPRYVMCYSYYAVQGSSLVDSVEAIGDRSPCTRCFLNFYRPQSLGQGYVFRSVS